MSRLYQINRLLTLVCLCGLGLSIYSYIVEVNFENDPNYKPLCDISPEISCSKAFTSKYGRGIGGLIEKKVPLFGFLADQQNSLFGILTYSLLATLSLSNSMFINNVLILSFILSLLISFYLAYILYVIKTICVVCVATYILNFMGITLTYMKRTELQNMEEKDKTKKSD